MKPPYEIHPVKVYLANLPPPQVYPGFVPPEVWMEGFNATLGLNTEEQHSGGEN